MAEKDKPYLVPPTTQVDLERRQKSDVPDAALATSRVMVNPNPFGAEEYVGTDPIYQNHANETEKPYASKKGPERTLEKQHHDLYKMDSKQKKTEDPGLGGEAPVAETTGVHATRYLVPGQEGYDRKKAEEQQGPPLAVLDEDSSDGDDEDVELDNPGTNMGASVQPPDPGKKPVPGAGSTTK